MSTLNNKIKTIHFLTDGGLETDLIFNKNIDLPHFAAFPLVEDPDLINILKDYYKAYMNIAKHHKTGFILESPTWRANPDWGFKLGYTKTDLIEVNKLAINKLKELKMLYAQDINDILVSGQIGPRGDGYEVGKAMTAAQSNEYHHLQIKAFGEAGVDLVSAITMTYTDEALGIVECAKSNGLPVVISFTVETDGNLPSGKSLKYAIEKIDAKTNKYPFYYMINCAHPSHFVKQLSENQNWRNRIKGVRANASCKSHTELDQSTTLDTGNKEDLAKWYNTLKTLLPGLSIYGGCCGTDATHIESICNRILN